MRHIHLVEIEYCKDTIPQNQVVVAQQQHSQLKMQLAGNQVILHTILLCVGGTIYIPHTLYQLTELSRFTKN